MWYGLLDLGMQNRVSCRAACGLGYTSSSVISTPQSIVSSLLGAGYWNILHKGSFSYNATIHELEQSLIATDPNCAANR